MLAAERQSKIIEMTERKGSVQVEELASELKVSAMTIRRDLVKLQEEGKLELLSWRSGGKAGRKLCTKTDKQ